MTDNSTESINYIEMQFGQIVFQRADLPQWIDFVLSEPTKANSTFSSIDEVREKYRQMRKKD